MGIPVTFRLAPPVLAPFRSLSYHGSIRRRGHFTPARIPVGEFGDTFRKERERKGISLEDVSNVTKISARMLRAIEEEHFDQLPGGVFNKGFVRTYAKHLGLNDDEAVASYLACLRRAQLDAQATWDPQARHAGQGGPNERGKSPHTQEEELPELQLPRAEHVAPPRRDYSERREAIPWRLLALVILVVVLTAILLHRNSGSARPQAATSTGLAATPAPQTTPSAEASPPPVPAAPARTQPSSAASGSPRSSAMSSPSPTSAQPPASAPVKAVADGADITNKTVDLQNPEPAATSTAPLTLVIRASEDSWISVSADGESVLHETLIAPAHTTVRAARRIVLRVGNAAGISFVWNGQEIPAQGVEGEVKALVFDASGMQVVSPPPLPVQNP